METISNSIVVRTIVPIFLLIGLGFFSRKKGILKSGDEKVLNSYVYYFALPALFLVDLSQTEFTEENLRFILAGIIPVITVTAFFVVLYFILRFSRETLYLLILSTVFGSLAFFGLPFIMFAFATKEAESLATLSAATISMASVAISIVVLEFYRLETPSLWNGIKLLIKKLPQNPLLLSIFAGIFLSVIDLKIPSPVMRALHMLGTTTATVAIFLLGVFLYGRTYRNVLRALQLSLLRVVFLPVVALVTTYVLNVQGLEKTTLVLMHGMPVAISMIILSERYNFHKETIASLILISSLTSGVYLNVWLLLLGH